MATLARLSTSLDRCSCWRTNINSSQILKQKLLTKHKKELKEAYDKGQCDVWFDYFQKGKGADARFDFIIHTKESDIKQTELWENMKTQTIYICQGAADNLQN